MKEPIDVKEPIDMKEPIDAAIVAIGSQWERFEACITLAEAIKVIADEKFSDEENPYRALDVTNFLAGMAVSILHEVHEGLDEAMDAVSEAKRKALVAEDGEPELRLEPESGGSTVQ
jgi:hypothetical protein